MEKILLVCLELLFQVRLSLCCLPQPTSRSTTAFFFWSVLSHWLSWHTQTETLLMSLKAFSAPPVLLEATKHQLSWPAITFSPLSASHLSTCRTPSSPLFVFPAARWHLNFPCPLSLLPSSSSFQPSLSLRTSIMFSQSRPQTLSWLLHALFLAGQIGEPFSCDSVCATIPANVCACTNVCVCVSLAYVCKTLLLNQVWNNFTCKALLESISLAHHKNWRKEICPPAPSPQKEYWPLRPV